MTNEPNEPNDKACYVNILPCPFCGSKNIFDGTKGMNTAHKRVVCLECNAQTSGIMSWNRRSPSITNSLENESLMSRVEQLEINLEKSMRLEIAIRQILTPDGRGRHEKALLLLELLFTEFKTVPTGKENER